MNATLKKYLVITAKHAVNVVLTNGGLSLVLPATFNFNSWGASVAYVKATAVLILGREFMVWAPKILKWSQTGTDINGNGDHAQGAAAGK